MEKPKNQWKYRRLVIFTTLAFCFGFMGYILVSDTSSPNHLAAFPALATLAGTVITGYVFGAVWDDNNTNKVAYKDNIQ